MSMKAVVIKAPYEVKVEERPIPKCKEATDIIVKVRTSGLCGSDLHIYHGHTTGYDFVMGHEFVGNVYEVGSSIKNFKVGDDVVSPFTTSCGDCFFCSRKQTGRCPKGKVYGSATLDGAQAEYVRVELADSTLYPAPKNIPDECLIVMADIAPTGYYVSQNANVMLTDYERKQETTCVVIGCGPVGLCAITAAASMFTHVYAIDQVPDRLEEAKKHGAKDAFTLGDNVEEEIKSLTEGRGADIVLEVVGAESALHLAMQIARPFGIISSCGIHTQPVSLHGPTLYNKNLRFQFGRCPVRAHFEPALKMVADHLETFKPFVQHSVSIDKAVEYYDLFDKRKIRKTVFTFP
jgi:threonine dehydrogenase-like Zn-dependent dehydrogenase